METEKFAAQRLSDEHLEFPSTIFIIVIRFSRARAQTPDTDFDGQLVFRMARCIFSRRRGISYAAALLIEINSAFYSNAKLCSATTRTRLQLQIELAMRCMSVLPWEGVCL